MSNLRSQLVERTLQACVDEYADKGRTFANLDTKAQNTATIAGIFLAATLAFFQGEGLRTFIQSVGAYALVVLGLAIILLLASILACLIGMRIRKTVSPIESDDLVKLLNDLLSVDPAELDTETVENYFRDQIHAWQDTLKMMSAVNEDKARAVLYGQVLLALAVLLVAGVLLVILTSVWGSPIS